jgi:anti-sigma-K factor RskA
MPDPIDVALSPHRKTEELLPWYATGQLDPGEVALVDEHLSNCAHCRRQLAGERRMIEEFAALTHQVDAGWARLRQRIAPQRRAAPPHGWSDKAAAELRGFWQSFSRPRVAAFAFAQLAFVVIAGSVLLSLSRPSYHALGSAPAPQSANLIVMFRPDTPEAEMRRLLRASAATLTGGPTETDAYLLRVPPRNRATVLAKLRGDDHVVMAQPIDAPST